MSGADVAGLAIAATGMCYDLAKALHSIIREVKSASDDAKIMQDSLAALHRRLEQVRSLFDQNVPHGPLEKDYRASILKTLERIHTDLEKLRNKLRLDQFMEARGSLRMTTWAVIQTQFESEEIKGLKERLSGSEALLQTHFEMLSLFINYKTRDITYTTRDEVANLTTLIRPVLKKLLQDATATEERQRLHATLTNSVDTLSGSHSELGYHRAYQSWKDSCEDMIESIKDVPLDDTKRSNYVPSIFEEGSQDDGMAPAVQNSTQMSREPLSPTSLPPVTEALDEMSSHEDQEEVLNWCAQQGYLVDKPNFRCDVSDDTAPNTLKGVSPIHQAIRINNMPILEQMLRWPSCNANVRLHDGREDATPFLLACSLRNKRAVQLLLASNTPVDVNATDQAGQTGLHLCQKSTPGGTRIAKLLIEHPKAQALDINAKDKHGKTAAHVAARIGDAHMLEYLFEKDGKRTADPNARQQDGSTPLMVALRSENSNANKKSIINLLVTCTDLKITNTKDEDVLKIAKQYTDSDVYRHLKTQMSQNEAFSRRTSEASTAYSRVSTQGTGETCIGCPKHCTEARNFRLSGPSSIFSMDSSNLPGWSRTLRKLSNPSLH